VRVLDDSCGWWWPLVMVALDSSYISHTNTICLTRLRVALHLFIVLNISRIFIVSILDFYLICHKTSCHTTESIFLCWINLFGAKTKGLQMEDPEISHSPDHVPSVTQMGQVHI
jgi:hypothetical protein